MSPYKFVTKAAIFILPYHKLTNVYQSYSICSVYVGTLVGPCKLVTKAAIFILPYHKLTNVYQSCSICSSVPFLESFDLGLSGYCNPTTWIGAFFRWANS